MVKILIDSCIWLDAAKDYQQQSLISALDELIESKEVELIVPATVIDEFNRNKSRIIEDNKRSMAGILRRVKEIVAKFGESGQKQIVIDHLTDVQHKTPFIGEYAAQGSINWISTLLRKGRKRKVTKEIKLNACERALLRKAPFHNGKNNIDDAIIIETFINELENNQSKQTKFMFVTSNYTDFSEPNGNRKRPHPDFLKYFSKRNSRYFISLVEALHAISPDIAPELIDQGEMFVRNPRTLSEILKEEDEFANKIWYNRHQNTRVKIKEGKIKIIEREDFKIESSQESVVRDIWEGALKSAKKLERAYGKDNLLWDDFEWGMLNGKLSALRWILGEDWDELYT